MTSEAHENFNSSTQFDSDILEVKLLSVLRFSLCRLVSIILISHSDVLDHFSYRRALMIGQIELVQNFVIIFGEFLAKGRLWLVDALKQDWVVLLFLRTVSCRLRTLISNPSWTIASSLSLTYVHLSTNLGVNSAFLMHMLDLCEI